MRPLVIAALAALAAGPAAAQDAAHGAKLFATNCGICHSVQANKNVMGPSLFGVVGRKAGSAPGFNYSPALQSSTVVWTDATLDQWLTAPREFIPRNRMSFAGLHTPTDRADVIAYLAKQK